MLFELNTKKISKWYNFWNVQQTKVEEHTYLCSALNEDVLIEYIERYIEISGTGYFVRLFGTTDFTWSQECQYSQVGGDDNDAHVLILESPTGVIYDRLLRRF